MNRYRKLIAVAALAFIAAPRAVAAGNDNPDAERLARARKAIREKDHALAESLIRAGVKAPAGDRRDAWRIVEADLRHTQKRFADAGVVAMRIVILRPKSDHVAAALYWAGRAYEGLNRPTKAEELYRECIGHKTCDNALEKRARKRLKLLKDDKPKASARLNLAPAGLNKFDA
jgi:hypothetical protein